MADTFRIAILTTQALSNRLLPQYISWVTYLATLILM